MTDDRRQRAGERSQLSPVGWLIIAIAIATFGGYFVLLLYCDIHNPELFGARLLAEPLQVEAITPGSPADRAGLKTGDVLKSVDNQPLRHRLDFTAFVARTEKDREMSLVYRRDGRDVPTPLVFHADRPLWMLPHGRVLLVTRVIQLITLLFAIALAVRPTGVSGKFGAWLSATIAVFNVALPPGLALYWERMPLPIGVLLFVPLTSTLFIGGSLFAFCVSFLDARMTPGRILLAVTPIVGIVVWQVAFSMRLVYDPQQLIDIDNQLPLIVITNFVYVVAGMALLVSSYRTLTDQNLRRKVKLVVIGSVAGSAAGAPTVTAMWLNAAGGPQTMYAPPMPLQLAFTGFLLMPISLWWAIARHRVFDVGFVVRRGMQYVFARQALLVISPLVTIALILEGTLNHQEPLRALLQHHALLYALAGAALVAFHFQRETLLNFLDRKLFRERYDAAELLRAVASKVRNTRNAEAAAQYAVEQIEAALHPRWLAILVRRPREDVFRPLASRALPPTAWLGRTTLMDFVRSLKKPVDISASGTAWLREQLPDRDLDVIRSSHAHLLVPIILDAQGSEAIMVLGSKQSEEPFSQEDKNLLQAVGENLADLMRPDQTTFDTPAERQPDASTSNDSDLQRWGPFILHAEVGKGSFGTVYRAWDTKLEREVAVKLLKPDTLLTGSSTLMEARLLARVKHPNVVDIYGADEFDGVVGFWMEFVQGRTLAQILREQGRFGADEAALAGISVCRALSAIHGAGLLHQDVKAENVMRERDGRLLLMDFGASTIQDATTRTVRGTLPYMAPELFDGAPATIATDIYSVGVLLFRLAADRFPVPGQSVREIKEAHARGVRRLLRDERPDISERFIEVVDQAIARNPAQRFSTAGELATALQSEQFTGAPVSTAFR